MFMIIFTKMIDKIKLMGKESKLKKLQFTLIDATINRN